jgi:hypothetical protein
VGDRRSGHEALAGMKPSKPGYEVGSGSCAFRVGPGEFAATEVTAPVGGTVPPTLSLTVGAATVGGSLLRSRSAPLSNDAVTIDFKQSIGANDALRTGAYAKTLTFTLSTTTP